MSGRELEILQEVVRRRDATKLSLLTGDVRGQLSPDDREALQEIVADELVEAGLSANDEPTSYGVVLEGVIDWLARKPRPEA